MLSYYRGRFYVPTVVGSARARHARKRPAVSLTYYRGNELAVIAHGSVELLPRSTPTSASWTPWRGSTPA
jgi:hypothetical protein